MQRGTLLAACLSLALATSAQASLISTVARVSLFGAASSLGDRDEIEWLEWLEQERTLHASASSGEGECWESVTDSASDFGVYDMSISAGCPYGSGSASQYSCLAPVGFIFAGGAGASGYCIAGHHGSGDGRSHFEAVFELTRPQLVYLAGELSVDDAYGGEYSSVHVTLSGGGPTYIDLGHSGSGQYVVDEVVDLPAGEYTLSARGWASASCDWAGAHFDLTFTRRCDCDGDGLVNVFDLLALFARWNESGGMEDINSDGIIDESDLEILIANWG
jgi:hypothetical protein